MNRKTTAAFWVLMLLVSQISTGQKVKFSLENQMSFWGTLNFESPVGFQAGGRYIPSFSITDSLKKERKLDAEVSINSFYNVSFEGKNYLGDDKKLDPYRLWIRYSTPQMEIRAGLQKINFGSASVLRPLMWFDKMDSRDPLQLTDGVYALLARYYFSNNANIWTWLLYGNDKQKGWEATPTSGKKPEYGGRFQFPVPKGEIGLSYDHRISDYSEFQKLNPAIPKSYFPEDKYAVDGKIDIGIGLWGEYVVKHNNKGNLILKEWETYLNVGADYTFLMGNGLTVSSEYFRYDSGSRFFEKDPVNSFSVLMLNYPLGLMNSAMAMVYYNWEQKEWYRFISLQRKYDFWSFYLMAFWNPERFGLLGGNSPGNLFAGKGIQFMAVVNF